MKKFNSLKFKKILFPFLGLAALIWFLIRVIPKPGRATYPCMRAAAPLASSFVIYIIGLLSTALIFTKAKSFFQKSKYVLFICATVLGLVVSFITMSTHNLANAAPPDDYNLVTATPDGPNQPMGTGVGVMPGRVAWVYNPDAVNENCPNSKNNYWYMDANTNQESVTKMFVEGLKMITNTATEEVAWDSIFHYFNRTHGKGNVGYTAGEKFVIKINQNAGENPGSKINTSPQLVYAIISSLINVVKVDQGDIIYGDPLSNTGTPYYNKINTAFPNVKCFGTSTGRTAVTFSTTEAITSSEAGTAHTTYMPESYVDATYMINAAVLKKHHRGGISLNSKLHFGTVGASENGAGNWHFSLPAPGGAGDVSNGDYSSYRCFVDFMGYKHLGRKTILFLIDGLWSSTNWAHPPIKWRMSPFNNDYPSSLFISQDQVAIESVGFDFLFNEFDQNHPTEGAFDPTDNKGPFPHYKGADDFLHQAADQANWPSSVIYAPNGDGVAIPSSMGTHEHWNNAVDKKYSRNLSQDKGIELIYNKLEPSVNNVRNIENNSELKCYPNPFNSYTTISYSLKSTSSVNLSIYDLKGSLVREIADYEQNAGTHELKWDGLNDNGLNSPAGIYVAKIQVRSNNDYQFQIAKLIKK